MEEAIFPPELSDENIWESTWIDCVSPFSCCLPIGFAPTQLGFDIWWLKLLTPSQRNLPFLKGSTKKGGNKKSTRKVMWKALFGSQVHRIKFPMICRDFILPCGWPLGVRKGTSPRCKAVRTVPNGVLLHVASIGSIEHLDQGTMSWDLEQKCWDFLLRLKYPVPSSLDFFEMNILFFYGYFGELFFLGSMKVVYT